MSTWLKQSTSVDVPVGPFLDDTDGKTAETGLTITQPDVRLKKNNGNWAQKAAAQTLTHEEAGWYEVTLDATDTNTLGVLVVAIHEAGALPVWREFMVVPANVWDSYLGADRLEVALTAETAGEPAQGAPGVTLSISDKIGYLFTGWRNRHTQTASEYALYADNGTTKIVESAVSDDGTTLDVSEKTTGA